MSGKVMIMKNFKASLLFASSLACASYVWGHVRMMSAEFSAFLDHLRPLVRIYIIMITQPPFLPSEIG